MKISQSLNSLKNNIQQWRADGQTIGFVPTMGNLHAGHITLVKQAQLSCDKVVVSIYVNPLQFNELSDFDAYPKTLQADQLKLSEAAVDLLFLPDNEMIYPHGQQATTKVCVPEITCELEGEHRPGHFDGVSTVVAKLFNLLQPHIAFFGEKDYQQLLLIKKMQLDLNQPLEIQAVPTCREADGLAMSSRNSRLSEEQRRLAPELYRVLQWVAEQLLKSGSAVFDIESQAIKILQQAGFEVEYISVRAPSNLQKVSSESSHRMVLAAVKLGDVRLIDNLIID